MPVWVTDLQETAAFFMVAGSRLDMCRKVASMNNAPRELLVREKKGFCQDGLSVGHLL